MDANIFATEICSRQVPNGEYIGEVRFTLDLEYQPILISISLTIQIVSTKLSLAATRAIYFLTVNGTVCAASLYI